MTEIQGNLHLQKSMGESSHEKNSMVSINVQDSTELIRLACEDLQAAYPKLNWKEGLLLNNVTRHEVEEWVKRVSE